MRAPAGKRRKLPRLSPRITPREIYLDFVYQLCIISSVKKCVFRSLRFAESKPLNLSQSLFLIVFIRQISKARH